jgi:hypothetical protein
MNCPKHPERQAEFMCAECGREVCADCIEDRAGKLVCGDCAAKLGTEAGGAPPPEPPAAQPAAAIPSQWPPSAPPPPPYRPAGVGPSGVSIASMVCGILSLVCCCGGGLSLVLGVTAVILGAIALGSAQPEPMRAAGRPYAIAGIITGSLAIVFFVLAIIGAIAFRELMPQWFRRPLPPPFRV